MSASLLPLAGKTALITGVSRRRGIGYSVAVALAELGANVVIHHHRAHDVVQPWGADDLAAVRAGVSASLIPGAAFADVGADFDDASSVNAVLDAAFAVTGAVDILVCNHAKSGNDGGILDMTPERLDAFWSTNTRSTLLLTAEYARRIAGEQGDSPARPGDRAAQSGPFAAPVGRVVWMTSGQIHGPMRGEVAYAASKAALAGVTPTVAAELLAFGIVLNTINPGPVNTGYMDPETTDRSLDALQAAEAATPFGRFGRPTDPANLIAWLSTDAGAWMVGQVLTSDGGFSIL